MMPHLLHRQILAEHLGYAYHSLKQVLGLLPLIAPVLFPYFVYIRYNSMILRVGMFLFF